MHFKFIQIDWTDGSKSVILVRSTLDTDKAVREYEQQATNFLYRGIQAARKAGLDVTDLERQMDSRVRISDYREIGTTDDGYNGIFRLSNHGVNLHHVADLVDPQNVHSI